MNKQNEDGLRVLAVAYKKMPPIDRPYSVQEEKGLILLGFVTFLDPPKETAAPAIKALKNHGVEIKVLTGDNDVVYDHAIIKPIAQRQIPMIGAGLDQLCLMSDHRLTPIPVGRTRATVGF